MVAHIIYSGHAFKFLPILGRVRLSLRWVVVANETDRATARRESAQAQTGPVHTAVEMARR